MLSVNRIRLSCIPRITGSVVFLLLFAWGSTPLAFGQQRIRDYENHSVVEEFGHTILRSDQLVNDEGIMLTTMMQQTRLLPQRVTQSPSVATNQSARSLLSGSTVDRSLLRQASLAGVSASSVRPLEVEPTFGTNSALRTNPELSLVRQARPFVNVGRSGIYGGESITRVTTDAGNVFSRTVEAPGINSQQRNPIVSDVRVRGTQTGRMGASGSYWVPARLDMDTALSKIDSRVLTEIASIKGPYSVRYGPGYRHIAFDLLDSPRSDERHVAGISGFQYGTNGQQWMGRQTFAVSDQDWGLRIGYRHSTGSDYLAGNGTEIPASYNSRDWNLAFGHNTEDGQSIEFHLIRLDQTNVDLPGQAFDIRVLETDGFSLNYEVDYDDSNRFRFETWLNETNFDGNAQNPGKRRQFPIFDALDFVGFTDVRSLSTGYNISRAISCEDDWQLLLGTDFRFVQQRLDEFSSAAGFGPFPGWLNVNSPIPNSTQPDAGLYLEYREQVGEYVDVEMGMRADIVSARVEDDFDLLQPLTPFGLPLEDVLGADQFDQDFFAPAAYVSAELDLLRNLQLQIGVGYAERVPNLTELFAAEPFMFVLQNGLNTVIGNPLLENEKMTQVDLGFAYETDSLRWQVSGFYGWARDFITYENTSAQLEQVRLKFVNTDRAHLAGLEMLLEKDLSRRLSLFASSSYLRGTDETRNGTSATRPADFQGGMAIPSQQVSGMPRGFFSGVTGGATEPLPNIVPLEGRIGSRLRGQWQELSWNVEFALRVVDDQHRVASSLLESTTPGFAVMDLRGYAQHPRGIRFVAGVENLGNKTYRNHLDFRSTRGIAVLQPGVNFYFGSDLFY